MRVFQIHTKKSSIQVSKNMTILQSEYNSLYPDQTTNTWRLIWIQTVCKIHRRTGISNTLNAEKGFPLCIFPFFYYFHPRGRFSCPLIIYTNSLDLDQAHTILRCPFKLLNWDWIRIRRCFGFIVNLTRTNKSTEYMKFCKHLRPNHLKAMLSLKSTILGAHF